MSLNLVCLMVAIWGVLAKGSNNNTNSSVTHPVAAILNKFHQNDYKIIFERSELARSNKSFVDFQIRTFKYNRTTPLVNASFIFTIDMGYDIEVIYQTYKFASNEYRIFPIRFEVNVCQGLASGLMGVDKLSKWGNLACPFQKGKKYYYYNWAPEEAKFPPLIPTGDYMVETQFVYHSEEFVVTNHYGIVARPIV